MGVGVVKEGWWYEEGGDEVEGADDGGHVLELHGGVQLSARCGGG